MPCWYNNVMMVRVDDGRGLISCLKGVVKAIGLLRTSMVLEVERSAEVGRSGLDGGFIFISHDEWQLRLHQQRATFIPYQGIRVCRTEGQRARGGRKSKRGDMFYCTEHGESLSRCMQVLQK